MNKSIKSLKQLPNIGNVFAIKLNKLGINSKEEFLEKDPYKVFEELLKKVDPTLCRCALACIIGANLGVPWHKITKDTAKEYKKRHPKHKWGKC